MKRITFIAFVLLVSSETYGVTSSEGFRADKTAYAAVEAIGLTLMPVQGGRVGYFITSDLVAEVAGGAGSAEIGDFKAEKTIVEAKAKYFFGNSFYADAGIAMESWDLNYSVISSDDQSLDSVPMKGRVTTTGVELHVGNQWQWDGFTLGCDWVGYFAGLSTASEFSGDEGADEVKKESEEEDAVSTFGGSSVHLTRLYLGWAF